jgi:hypothetical protein
VILQLPNGQHVGIVYLADGSTVLVPTVQIIKLPDPTPPVPQTTGPVTTVIIRIASKLTSQQSTALLEIHDWMDQQTEGQVLEFPPDAINTDGTTNQQVKAFVSRISAGGSFPYCFVTQGDGSGKSVIVWQGPLTNSAEMIDRIKSFSKAKASSHGN